MDKRIIYGLVATAVVAIAVYLAFFSKPQYEPGEMEEHIRGNPNAAVAIVEFSDFQCPYCGRVQPTLEQLLQEYGDNITLIYRHFPLPSHANSEKAAEASECASDQGKFWEYHDMLFDNQDRLDTASLKRYAGELNLDVNKFSACLDSGVMSPRVDFAKRSGVEKGVAGTPAFFVNGKMISGNQPYNIFKAAVDAELKG